MRYPIGLHHTVVVLLLHLLVVVVGGGGCTSELRQPVQQLADHGGTLATTAQASIAGVRTSLDRYIEARYLNSGLSAGLPAPTTQEINDIERIQRAVLLREASFAKLAEVYLSFKAIGEYDAGADVEARLDGLTTSVNEFAVTVEPSRPPPLNNMTSGIITKLGAGLAAKAQDGKIRKASELIRLNLVALRAALEAERGHLYGLSHDALEEEDRLRRRLAAQEELRNAPALDDSVDLAEIIAAHGVEADPATARRLIDRLGPRMRDQVQALRSRRSQQQILKQTELLDAAVTSIDALVTQHEQLERGQALSLQTVRARIIAMAALVEEYKKWRAADEAAEQAREQARKKPATNPS
jgi:hypothetical protein